MHTNVFHNDNTAWFKEMDSISYCFYCSIESIFLNHPVYCNTDCDRIYAFLFQQESATAHTANNSVRFEYIHYFNNNNNNNNNNKRWYQ